MLARNLATKFICLGILTAMLPIMLFSFLLINQQGNSIRRETLQRGADDVRQMAARLDTVLVQLRNINNFYYFDPDIADLVRKDGTTIAQDKRSYLPNIRQGRTAWTFIHWWYGWMGKCMEMRTVWRIFRLQPFKIGLFIRIL